VKVNIILLKKKLNMQNFYFLKKRTIIAAHRFLSTNGVNLTRSAGVKNNMTNAPINKLSTDPNMSTETINNKSNEPINNKSNEPSSTDPINNKKKSNNHILKKSIHPGKKKSALATQKCPLNKKSKKHNNICIDPNKLTDKYTYLGDFATANPDINFG